MITCIISTGIIFGFVLNPLSWSFATFQKYHVLGMAASPPRNTLPTSLEISGTHSLSDHPGHFLYCVSSDEIRPRAKCLAVFFYWTANPHLCSYKWMYVPPNVQVWMGPRKGWMHAGTPIKTPESNTTHLDSALLSCLSNVRVLGKQQHRCVKPLTRIFARSTH